MFKEKIKILLLFYKETSSHIFRKVSPFVGSSMGPSVNLSVSLKSVIFAIFNDYFFWVKGDFAHDF